VIGAQAGLPDRKGAPEERAGCGQVALSSQDGGEVVEAGSGVGVVEAQAGLADVKGALVQGAGGLEVALGVQDGGEVVEAPEPAVEPEERAIKAPTPTRRALQTLAGNRWVDSAYPRGEEGEGTA
jgi:hypothetical protein